MFEKPLVLIDLDLTARTWLEHLCPSPILTPRDYHRYLKHPHKFELEVNLRTVHPNPRRGLNEGIRKVIEFLTANDIAFQFISYLDPDEYGDTLHKTRVDQAEWVYNVVDINFDVNTADTIYYSFSPDYSGYATADRILIDSSPCRCRAWSAKRGKSICIPYLNSGDFAITCLKELMDLRP